MTKFQRIVTLLLLALFVLQICAQEDMQNDQNMMTVTLNNEQTKTAIEQHIQSQSEKDVDQKSDKEEDNKEKKLKEEEPKGISEAEEHADKEKPKEETFQAEEHTDKEKPKEEDLKTEISKQETSEKDNVKEEKPREEKPQEKKLKEEKPKEVSPKEVSPKEINPKDENPKELQKADNSMEHDQHPTEFERSKSTKKEESSNEHFSKGNLHKSDNGENHHSKEEHEIKENLDSFFEEHGEEDPFEGYMGEEIDQYLGDDHPNSRYEEDDHMHAPPTAAEEEPIVADATNTTEPTPSAPRPPAPQVTGCKTQGQIALTYSEGPSDVTAKIVRQLTKADARANFFVNATWLYTQQYAMVVQNIYNAGHFIGMTYRVPNDDPASITDDQLRRDIINNAHTIESLINVSPKYVRLHYTEFKDVRTESILQDLGFVIVGYNLDSQDYFKKDATGLGSINQIYEDTFVKYKDTYDAKGSFISIQYDLPYTGSLAAIPHVINTIDKEGYTMVRLDGCLNDATPYKKSANGTEYVSDKFSFGQSAYHQGQKSVTIETAAEAAEADENFNIQGLEANMANTQQVSLSLILALVGVVFTLFL